jgi:hypothetical protein
MDTIISITSIPSRFKYLPQIVKNLTHQGAKEVLVNIPREYSRWPDEKVEVPPELYYIPGARVIRCEDYGPGTVYMAPLDIQSTAKYLMAVDDDTAYPSNLLSTLHSAIVEDPCVWCTSGFRIPEFFEKCGGIPRYHRGAVDVAEGYGGVMVEMDWIRQGRAYFEWMRAKYTHYDDLLLSNTMAHLNIPRKSWCDSVLNVQMIRQYSFGMEEDALWRQGGEGGHFATYAPVLNRLREDGEYNYSTTWQSGIASSSTTN